MKKFFLLDDVLYSMPWLYLASTLIWAIMLLEIGFSVYGLITSVLLFLLIAAITVCYRKHEKNAMKALLGALLMSCVLFALNSLISLVEAGDTSLNIVFAAIYTVLYAALFVNHILLGVGHSAKPVNVTLNSVLSILIVLVVLVWNIVGLSDEISIVTRILAAISEFSLVASIISIETRVDSFKRDREEAGWTQEKGYPEGYVHEYEKTK